MYLDRDMLIIMFRHFGLNVIQIESLIEQYSDSFFELIIMKIFNRYFATHTQEEALKLEEEMAEIKKTGNFEKQQQMIEILKETMISNPDLADEIRNDISKLYAEIFFDFMKEATPEGQIEILTYMLNKKRDIKEEGKMLEEITRRKKLLVPDKK
jgi:hypothetical protein